MRKVIICALAFMLFCSAMTGCGDSTKDEAAYSMDSEYEEEQESIVEEEVILESISLSVSPDKTDYYVGDSFDPKGMEITAEYSDGRSEKVVDGYTFYPEVFNEEGNKAVTIDFQGCKTTIAVSVSKKPEVIESGTFGENITWTITDDGTLTISGTEMPESDECSVQKVNMSKNIEVIGDFAFRNCMNLKSITIPKSIKNIEDGAFSNYSGSFKIIYEGSAADWSNVTVIDKWIDMLTCRECTVQYDVEFLS